MIKRKEINDKNKQIDEDDNNSDTGNYLNYIKINGLDKLEEIDNDAYIQQCIMFSSALAQENENNIGQEINKFFNLILTENKEGEPLKVNIAISNRYTKEKNVDKQIDFILNTKFGSDIALNSEISENIAIILTTIYQKIQSKYKFNSFDELVNKINNYDTSTKDILRQYLITDEELKRRELIYSTPVKADYEINRFISSSPNKKRKSDPNNNDIIKKNISTISQSKSKKEKIIYEFKEQENDKNFPFPIEMLILKQKFQMIKRLKLIISNSRSKNDKNIFDSDSFIEGDNASFVNISFSSSVSEKNLKQKDVQNIIFVLLNLNWLFPNIIEIEIDLSNDNIMKDQIGVYKSGLKFFSKILKRNLKNTDYSQNKIKKINYDPLHGSIFENYFPVEDNVEECSSDSNTSFSLKVNSFPDLDENLINSENENKVVYNYIEDTQYNSFDNLIKRFQCTFQMIIIYAFFISKIPKLFFCNFTIPFTFENEILRMLQIEQIYLPDFNLLSFLSDAKMIKITIDFNALDNKAFQEVLSLLFKNNNLSICQLNFFPSENYFIPELLLKLLQDCNSNYKITSKSQFDKSILGKIEPYEDVDIFLFKKLSEYFEININKLFQTISIRSTVKELSLIFNIPSLIKKMDFYIRVILKFIINIFIAIDNMKLTLSTFNLQTSNFFFDGNKYPFLDEFFGKLCIYSNHELILSKLTCQMKFKNITNIYRIIPYNVTQLSIGELDYQTFIHFTEYITSSQFSRHSQLYKLKLYLSNNLINIDECYEYLLRLITEYPKGLKEIGINTHFIIKKEQMDNLLKSVDYNTIESLYMNFNNQSLKDKGYELIKKDIFFTNEINLLNEGNYIKIYFTKRTNKSIVNIRDNIMTNLSLKYNKDFLDYDIFKSLERFICEKEKKKYVIQFT
jgi:hypothetical protein